MPWTRKQADERRAQILGALKAAKGNVTKTAEALGITRTTLYTHAQKLGLERDFGLDGEPKAPQPLPPSEARCAVTVKLPEALWQWARIEAIKRDRKASDIVQQALERLRAEVEGAEK